MLFAQEVLGLSAAGFGALGIAFAIGAILDSITAERVAATFGRGNSLFATMLVSALIGSIPSVPMVFSM